MGLWAPASSGLQRPAGLTRPRLELTRRNVHERHRARRVAHTCCTLGAPREGPRWWPATFGNALTVPLYRVARYRCSLGSRQVLASVGSSVDVLQRYDATRYYSSPGCGDRGTRILECVGCTLVAASTGFGLPTATPTPNRAAMPPVRCSLSLLRTSTGGASLPGCHSSAHWSTASSVRPQLQTCEEHQTGECSGNTGPVM